ncbi:Uncharacterised protein [Mycobacteroides abscessus subsp. abscessus]|nr:Uncharacterised protein [Mycobacteroides abscessus subsp. abscessus]
MSLVLAVANLGGRADRLVNVRITVGSDYTVTVLTDRNVRGVIQATEGPEDRSTTATRLEAPLSVRCLVDLSLVRTMLAQRARDVAKTDQRGREIDGPSGLQYRGEIVRDSSSGLSSRNARRVNSGRHPWKDVVALENIVICLVNLLLGLLVTTQTGHESVKVNAALVPQVSVTTPDRARTDNRLQLLLASAKELTALCVVTREHRRKKLCIALNQVGATSILKEVPIPQAGDGVLLGALGGLGYTLRVEVASDVVNSTLQAIEGNPLPISVFGSLAVRLSELIDGNDRAAYGSGECQRSE